MEKVVLRRIVYLNEPIPDPNGVNPKAERPLVIVRLGDEPITEESRVYLVAITGELPTKLSDDYVLLKYGHQSRSRLSKRSAALCTWGGWTPVSNIRDFGGLIDIAELHRILARIAKLHSGGS